MSKRSCTVSPGLTPAFSRSTTLVPHDPKTEPGLVPEKAGSLAIGLVLPPASVSSTSL